MNLIFFEIVGTMKSGMDQDRKLLFVEDDLDIIETVSIFLRQERIEFHVARNGLEAIDLIEKTEFHAVLCDINMPLMNGIELLQRCCEVGLPTPFVFFTAHTDYEFMLPAIKLGAFDFISKPFVPKELVISVYRALEVGSRRLHLFKELKKDLPDQYEKILKIETEVLKFRRSLTKMK